MNRSKYRSVVIATIAMAMFCLNGCGSKESKFEGTYQNKSKDTLVIKSEHKGTLDMGGNAGDITWEMAGDDKIVVHAVMAISMFRTSDGNLRDEENTVWTKK